MRDKCIAYAGTAPPGAGRSDDLGRVRSRAFRLFPMPAGSMLPCRAGVVSKTCPVRFDNNKHSIAASAELLPDPLDDGAAGEAADDRQHLFLRLVR